MSGVWSDSAQHAGAAVRDELVFVHSELEAQARALHGDELVDAVVSAYGCKREGLMANTARLRKLIECPVSPIGCLQIPECQRECEREETEC